MLLIKPKNNCMEFFIIIAILFACSIGLSIKVLAGREFKGACSTQNVNGNGICTVCGQKKIDKNDCTKNN